MLLAGSCDWLEVSPSNEVNEEDLFAKGSGYRNALNGIYLNMSDNSLYGRNLSYGFIAVSYTHLLSLNNLVLILASCC